MRYHLFVGGAMLAAIPVPRAARVTICLAPATIEATPANATDAMAALQGAFEGLLGSPSTEVKVLESRLPSQVLDEARAAGCPFLLLPSMKHVRIDGSRALFAKRMLGGAVRAGTATAGSAVASSVSGSVGGATGRVLGSAAAGATYSAGNAAATALYTKSISVRDEVTLRTRLEASDGTVLVDRSDRRKAQGDGEDLITPLAQQAADEVARAITRK